MLARWGQLTKILLASTVFCGYQSATAKSQDINLFEKFTTKGIGLNASTVIVLPPPLLDGKPTSEIKSALEKLSERQGWERFSKNSVSAPIHIDLSYVMEGGKKSTTSASSDADNSKRLGHDIYNAFIAYSRLDSLKDQQLMSTLFGSSAEDKELMGFDPVEVPPEVLKLVGITDVGPHTRYSTLRIPLMNRVLVEGTARIDKIERKGSIIIAWQLDQHFTLEKPEGVSPELAKYINRSRKVGRDEFGKVTQSDPVSYVGCGGYLCVTETGLAENQLLIESRLVMQEPNDWFSGSNFLRSKFPTAMQESAQTFRRKLSGK